MSSGFYLCITRSFALSIRCALSVQTIDCKGMRIAQGEVFDPVAPIITVDNENEAIKIANDSQL
jgi:hypothetical protein